ncbi:MAG TPA: AlpA family transcriptional regulator [Noviherbaspirillum sp.]|nr:AlpA family transcriptional regulator [Noviherbaspirillum sp.]
MTSQTIIRLPQVKERTGLSRTTLYSLIKEGKFARPISIGARAVGWLSSDIDAWIEARVKASRSTNS